MKKKENKKVVFRRIGGRIIPIAIGANLLRVGASEIRTKSGNIDSVSRKNFLSSGKTIKSSIRGKQIARVDLINKKFLGKKTTFIRMFQGAGRASMSAINNESVLSKTESIKGHIASVDSIKFTARHGGTLESIGVRKGKILRSVLSVKGAKSHLTKVLKGSSNRILNASFKNTGKVMGKVSRYNKKFLALGVASVALGLFNKD